MEEFPEDSYTVPVLEPEARPLLSWGAVVGAAFGLALGFIWSRYGFGAALGTALLAAIGGYLGRHYIAD